MSFSATITCAWIALHPQSSTRSTDEGITCPVLEYLMYLIDQNLVSISYFIKFVCYQILIAFSGFALKSVLIKISFFPYYFIPTSYCAAQIPNHSSAIPLPFPVHVAYQINCGISHPGAMDPPPGVARMGGGFHHVVFSPLLARNTPNIFRGPRPFLK